MPRAFREVAHNFIGPRWGECLAHAGSQQVEYRGVVIGENHAKSDAQRVTGGFELDANCLNSAFQGGPYGFG